MFIWCLKTSKAMQIYEKLLSFIREFSVCITSAGPLFFLPFQPLLRQFIIETLLLAECSVIFYFPAVEHRSMLCLNSLQNAYIHNINKSLFKTKQSPYKSILGKYGRFYSVTHSGNTQLFYCFTPKYSASAF